MVRGAHARKDRENVLKVHEYWSDSGLAGPALIGAPALRKGGSDL